VSDFTLCRALDAPKGPEVSAAKFRFLKGRKRAPPNRRRMRAQRRLLLIDDMLAGWPPRPAATQRAYIEASARARSTVGPNQRQIHQALDAETARQPSSIAAATIGGATKASDQRHADRTFGLALAGGNGRRGLIGVTRQFIKPAMGVAERFGEDSPRPDPHRTDRGPDRVVQR